MVRPRRDEYERVSTIGARRTIPNIDPMHPDMTRATFRSRAPDSSTALGRQSNEELENAGLRLSRKGFAAIPDHLLGRFEHMKGQSIQRGGANGQTHAMIYRIGIIILQCRPCMTGRAAVAEDGLFGSSARLVTSSFYSCGPGEPLGGSWRPRGRPQRPSRAWTVPMDGWTE